MKTFIPFRVYPWTATHPIQNISGIDSLECSRYSSHIPMTVKNIRKSASFAFLENVKSRKVPNLASKADTTFFCKKSEWLMHHELEHRHGKV